jgi:hypothetical protein
MTQVTEIFDTEGKLLGWVSQSIMSGSWRALSPDGWVVYCTSRAAAETALKEGQRV